MFGLMKTSVKDETAQEEPLSLARLHAGCVVGFGFMPQKSVSGKRVAIGEVGSYLFDSDSFVSYRLESDGADTSLIIADEDDPTGSYLALSQRIEARYMDAIFSASKPDAWFALQEGGAVEASPPILGALQGWLTKRYTLAVKMTGRFLEGDWRLRKPADRTLLARPFDYILLVDEDNEYALEAEKYEDGEMKVFATLYRPVTDIGEIKRVPRPHTPSVESILHIAPVAPKEAPAAQANAPIEKAVIPEAEAPSAPQATEAVIEPISEIIKPMEASKKTLLPADQASVENPQIESTVPAPLPVIPALKTLAAQDQDNEKPASAIASETKHAPVISVASAEQETESPAEKQAEPNSFDERIQLINANEKAPYAANMLACDLRLASRLLDEALRNQMVLSELIRKIIDLPARVQDKVLIPFALDDSEIAELARRYGLPATDEAGVKREIIEELKRFVGEKK